VLKACTVLLLWVVSVSPSSAAHAPLKRASKVCDPHTQTISVRKLFRQLKAIGGPLARHTRHSRLQVTGRSAHLQIGSRRASLNDDDAIQNDAPAAQADSNPLVEPERLVTFVDGFEQTPLSLAYSPRSPRGPPAQP
jgi:hypothetical protein